MSEDVLSGQFILKHPQHSSRLPWDTVKQAGAIHVGTMSQTRKLESDSTTRPMDINIGHNRKAAFVNPGPSDTTALAWQPGVEHHPEVLSDEQANLAHYHHSLIHGYARGDTIDGSLPDGRFHDDGSYHKSPYGQNEPPPAPHPDSVVGRAVTALNQGKVISYNNMYETDTVGTSGTPGKSISHLVPDPHRMLRRMEESPTPVHPTLFDAGQFAGAGPFRHAFNATPEDIKKVDVPGQHGQGESAVFDVHKVGDPHRPLTFDEKTKQSRNARNREMFPTPKSDKYEAHRESTQGTLF